MLKDSQRIRRWLPTLGVSLACFVVCVVLQVENRAYVTDFAGHPDEATHVVTGLMVRDFLAGGFTEQAHPLRYAERYVESYPKVGLGHYPPVFYAVEGLWLLPGDSPRMVLLLQALICALCAGLIFALGRRCLPAPASVVAALLFCLLPLTQRYTAIVMSDLLLALLCLAATALFVSFARSGSARASLGFGLLAAAAILTKASGLLLALVPPLLIVFGGRYDLLRRRNLWIGVIPVLVLALPWMVLTYSITKEGAQNVGLAEYLVSALPFYVGGLWRVFGIPVIVAAALGGALAVRKARSEQNGSSMLLGCAALSVSGLVFYIVAPSGLDDRYLLAIAPPMVLLAVSAVHIAAIAIGRRCGEGGRLRKPAFLVVCGLAFAYSFGFFVSPDKRASGFSAVVAAIDGDFLGDGPIRVLASSDPRGEGALVAAAALAAEKRPAGEVIVARGSKFIANVKWMGQDFKLKYDSPAALLDAMRGRFDYLVVDGGVPPNRIRPDHELVTALVDDAVAAELIPVTAIRSERAKGIEAIIEIYKIRPAGNDD